MCINLNLFQARRPYLNLAKAGSDDLLPELRAGNEEDIP